MLAFMGDGVSHILFNEPFHSETPDLLLGDRPRVSKRKSMTPATESASLANAEPETSNDALPETLLAKLIASIPYKRQADGETFPEPLPFQPAPTSRLYETSDFSILDVETTGTDQDKDKIVEIAIVRVTNGNLRVFSTLVNPGMPIPASSSAVHHITDGMVRNAPYIEEIAPLINAFMGDSRPVAHNGKFDSGFVNPATGRPYSNEKHGTNEFLCTLRLHRHLHPDIEEGTNQALHYLWRTQPIGKELTAHRALDDVYVTLENFKHMLFECESLGMTTLDAVKAHADSPIFSRLTPGRKWADYEITDRTVPDSYLDWCLTGWTDLDYDGRETVLREVARRAEMTAQAENEDVSQYNPDPVFAAGKKHATSRVSEIPADYLKWAVESNLRVTREVRHAMEQRLANQKVAPKADAAPRFPAPSQDEPPPYFSENPDPGAAPSRPAAAPARVPSQPSAGATPPASRPRSLFDR
jgi:DNA polymerase III epsilon subunit family exonuclease